MYYVRAIKTYRISGKILHDQHIIDVNIFFARRVRQTYRHRDESIILSTQIIYALNCKVLLPASLAEGNLHIRTRETYYLRTVI